MGERQQNLWKPRFMFYAIHILIFKEKQDWMEFWGINLKTVAENQKDEGRAEPCDPETDSLHHIKSLQEPAVGLEADAMTFWGKKKILSLMATKNPAFIVSDFHLKKEKEKS